MSAERAMNQFPDYESCINKALAEAKSDSYITGTQFSIEAFNKLRERASTGHSPSALYISQYPYCPWCEPRCPNCGRPYRAIPWQYPYYPPYTPWPWYGNGTITYNTGTQEL